jgi:hypothetical protein
MAETAGFTVQKVWTDAEQLFSVQFLTRQEARSPKRGQTYFQKYKNRSDPF